MTYSEEAIFDGLEACLDQIFLGQVDSDRLIARLDELLADSLSPSWDRQALCCAFCDKGLARLLNDPMPFRAIMLAELVSRVAQWDGQQWGVLTILMCAYRLIGLHQFAEALSILDRDEDFAGKAGGLEAKLADVLRLRCYARLGMAATADECVAGYESRERPLPYDHATVDLLLAGALAASSLSKHAVAQARALLASKIYDDLKTRAPIREQLASLILAPLSSARIHTVGGLVLRQSGDTLRAIEEFQLGRHQAKTVGDPRGAAICLSEIGISWQRMAEFDRGRRILNQAASEAEELGEQDMAARWRGTFVTDSEGWQLLSGYDGLAAVGARLKDAADRPDSGAEAIAKKIVREAQESDKTLEAAARNTLAYCYSLRGHFHQALAQTVVAIQIADSAGDRWSGMIFRGNRANLAFRANKFDDAERAASEAVELAAIFRSETNASEVRQAAAAALVNASEVLITLWGLEMTSSTGEIRRPLPDKIVDLSQKVRSRNFDHWLTLMNSAMQEPNGTEKDVVRELIEAEVSVETASQSDDSLSTQLQTLDRASKALSDSYVKTMPAPRSPESLGLIDAMNHLGEDDIMLDLNPVQSGLICIVAGPKRQVECFEIPWGRNARAGWLDRWRQISCGSVSRGRRTRLRMPVESPSGGPIQQLIDAALVDLDLNFVHPLYKGIGRDAGRIICSIHAELFGIPLWSLARANTNLVLSIVPSVASISLLGRRPLSRGDRCVKIGDATNSLEMVPTELKALTGFELLEPDRSSLSRELSGASRIHFAGHGEFIEENPYLSGVIVRGDACSPYAVSDISQGCVRLTLQGLIHDWDVTNCDLAVLSACSTGVPRVHPASEFTSISSALLVAGARNVIAASWPADDVATMLLMRRFYELLGCDRSPARALAKARQSLATMSREMAIAIVGDEESIPGGEMPFASALFTDTFSHFGIA
jgi:tetratricopeptide (TPR) repeat protein